MASIRLTALAAATALGTIVALTGGADAHGLRHYGWHSGWHKDWHKHRGVHYGYAPRYGYGRYGFAPRYARYGYARPMPAATYAWGGAPSVYGAAAPAWGAGGCASPAYYGYGGAYDDGLFGLGFPGGGLFGLGLGPL